MKTEAREALRIEKGYLTVATVERLVAESLGAISVLAIVGRCRSGKTWAAKDWVAASDSNKNRAAYVDCKGIGFGSTGVVEFDGVSRDLPAGHYPEFSLQGVDIVVVDEPSCNKAFVQGLIRRTGPVAAGAHRLTVLLIQHERHLVEFGLNQEIAKCYSTAGIPIRFPIG